jgi:hypothetical protein
MSFSVITSTLSAAVADAGTVAFSYPSGKNLASFYGSYGHKLMLGQNGPLSYPDDFDITLAATTITLTNKTGATWAAGTEIRLQVEEQGERGYRGANGQLLASSTELEGIMVSIAPLTADADGVSASQTVTGAGTAFLINGALASGGAVTFDTPRNVVGAWTNTAIITITGTDVYGEAMVETSASGTSHAGLKAFKTVTRVTTSATVTSATVGSGNVIGLPVVLPSAGNVIRVMQDGVPLPRDFVTQTEIDETRLLAGTSVFVMTPYAGFITRASTVVTTAVGTGGTLTVEIGGTAVTTLAVVVANSAAVGEIDTDVPAAAALVGQADITAQVAARGAIEIVGDSAFATTGSLSAYIELNTQGIFTAAGAVAGGQLSTSADVRGTFRPPVDPNGSITWQILLSLADAGLDGQPQYAG